MRRVYLDSAPVIYIVEQATPYHAQVNALLTLDDWIVVSQLTRMECRVLPIRIGDQARLKDFDEFFADFVDEIVPVSEQVIDKATEIRAVYSYRPMDALHLAAAVVAGCEIFLTNDLRLANFTEIHVLTL
ncbi:MAG: PIN domain-containing protein [Fimbriimonadales bacterium]|nr:PIN domain-containing protein [Fimbriimonadales bacterium]